MSNGASTVVSFPQPIQCHICTETTDYQLTICKRCKQHFCTKHSSKIDPNYCEHCITDVTVTTETFQRTDEVYDEEKDEVKVIKSPLAKQIKLSGADWVFFATAINEMSEEQLRTAWQWYKAAVSLMEMELTQKAVRKAVGLRMADGSLGGVTKKTTEVKTTTTRKQKKPVDLEALAKLFKNAGITPEMIAAMGKK